MKIPTVTLLLVALALAGCASDDLEGRTALQAIAAGDKVAAGVLEEPMFLYAVAAEGPQAVEFYESWLISDVATAPFDFELDVTGDVMKDGRAMSWIILYESQVNGQLAMVHVGETKGSKLLEHMDDGHTHMADLSLGGEGNYCQTSPDFETDSNEMALMLNGNLEYLEFQNQTPPDTRYYFLFAEGSCFNAEIVHLMGMSANETEAGAIMVDGADNLEFSFEEPGPLTIINQIDTFTAGVDQAIESPEHEVAFDVPANDTASITVAWASTDTLLPGESVHVYLESPSGARQDLATFAGTVAAKQAYYELTAGEWSVIYHSTTLQPLSEFTVVTIVTI